MNRAKLLQLIALEHLRDYVEANNGRLPATEHGALARATQKEIRNLELKLQPVTLGRPRSQVDEAEVHRLKATHSTRAIAAKLGCSHGTVANIINRGLGV